MNVNKCHFPQFAPFGGSWEHVQKKKALFSILLFRVNTGTVGTCTALGAVIFNHISLHSESTQPQFALKAGIISFAWPTSTFAH